MPPSASHSRRAPQPAGSLIRELYHCASGCTHAGASRRRASARAHPSLGSIRPHLADPPSLARPTLPAVSETLLQSLHLSQSS